MQKIKQTVNETMKKFCLRIQEVYSIPFEESFNIWVNGREEVEKREEKKENISEPSEASQDEEKEPKKVRKKKVRYNGEFLKKYLEENEVKIVGEIDFSKVNRETRIKGMCITQGCNQGFEKTFRTIIENGGAYCLCCTQKNTTKKVCKTFSRDRYDGEFLKKYLEKNEVTLQGEIDFEKVNHYTLIQGKCIEVGCDEFFIKKFRMVVNHGGPYCKKCTTKNAKNKSKVTYKTKTGFEHQSQNPQIQEMKRLNYKNKTGYFYPGQNPEVKEKSKATYKSKTGFSNPSQNPEVKEKMKATYKSKTGFENPNQNSEVREKIKVTYKSKTGFENPSQNPQVQEMKKINYKIKTGFEYPAQNPQVREKIEITNVLKYGCKVPSQNQKIKEKIEETNTLRYGCKNAMHNRVIFQKSQKNSYLYKDYKSPSGKVLRIQGYEHLALNELFLELKYPEEDVFVGGTDMPQIQYKTEDNVSHFYYPDIYIKSENRIIEVKSNWTFKLHEEINLLKQQACLRDGFLFKFWIYNKKGDKTIL